MPRCSKLTVEIVAAELVVSGGQVLENDLGLPARDARQLMQAIAREVCILNAGCEIYVQREVAGDRDDRIRAAYATDGPNGARRFTAGRIRQLAEEHDLSPVRIRTIVQHPAARCYDDSPSRETLCLSVPG